MEFSFVRFVKSGNPHQSCDKEGLSWFVVAAVNRTNMWRQVVLQLSLLFSVRCMIVMPAEQYGLSTQMSCIQYEPINHNRVGRMIHEEWRSPDPVIRRIIAKPLSSMPTDFSFHLPLMSRRIDNIFDNIIPGSDHLLKEHAKLVQDINSLRQVLYIPPFREENKDYDESIFHEIIETSTAPRLATRALPKPSSTKPPITSTKGNIPIILLGGESQRQVVKSQPISFMKPTINLVGTTASPSRHPYPFVINALGKPIKVCMTALPPIYPATMKPPSLWSRFLDYIKPLRSLGR